VARFAYDYDAETRLIRGTNGAATLTLAYDPTGRELP